MTSSNFYFLALKPSLPEELSTRAVQKKMLAPSNLEAVVKPIFLPLSFQFNTDDDGIFELGNSLQRSLYQTNSFTLGFKQPEFNNTLKQISIQPEPNQTLENIKDLITRVLLEWDNFAHSPVAFEFPQVSLALARSKWSTVEFELTKARCFSTEIHLKWTVETVSMMEWTNQGWNEKFFFPLEDQRLLRNHSNTILQDK